MGILDQLRDAVALPPTPGRVFDTPQQIHTAHPAPGLVQQGGAVLHVGGADPGYSGGTATVTDQLATIVPASSEPREVTIYNEGVTIVRVGASGVGFTWQLGGFIIAPGHEYRTTLAGDIAAVAPPHAVVTVSITIGSARA